MYADRRIKTGGLKIETRGLVIEPECLRIEIGGLPQYSANERPVTIDILLHKTGVLTTKTDVVRRNLLFLLLTVSRL